MQDRDDADFAQFAAARWAGLVRIASMITRDFHEAEDLVQTTLIRLYPRWPQIRGGPEGEAYVRRALFNNHLNRTRRRRVLQFLTPFLPDAASAEPQSVEEREGFEELIVSLPPRQQAVIVLRYWEDLADEEIAKVLGCSASTVRSQISRALAKLRSGNGSALLTMEEA